MNPFPRELRAFAVIACSATLVLAVLLALTQGLPSGGPLALFVALAVYSSQREVSLPNGVSLSPALIVCVAAVVVFRGDGSLLGPMLVGAATAIYFAGFGRDTWGWVPFNAALCGLAYLSASAVYGLLPISAIHSTPLAVAASLPCIAAYLAAAWSLLLLSYVVEGSRPWREVLAELLPTAVDTVPFAILGFFLGRLYLSLGPAVLLLVIVPILIARETFASYMSVKEAHDETVKLLVRALEQKDPYTAGHAGRVAVYAGYIADELDFMPARSERLRFAALMHDIGKLVVPNQLLNKPGKLTQEEYARVRVHEGVSVQMLSHIDFLRPIA
ncbi:MAG: HD-GYP domain-containing protein, partial [Actinomycetota bacterium]